MRKTIILAAAIMALGVVSIATDLIRAGYLPLGNSLTAHSAHPVQTAGRAGTRNVDPI